MSSASLPRLLVVSVFVLALLPLQACNTTAGLGEDVSAGADAVTKSAEKNKNY